ncbi:hypothetical protein CDAR_238921 [Caerostris darwini]|uniref:Secreted protein n=1 Tax=Caerostris darwini TaxID=1538125 RepID=A0AAV4PRZ7_9ARAC|nr:hypothetical protein CDAR_238921 [Caerostris darwini]
MDRIRFHAIIFLHLNCNFIINCIQRHSQPASSQIGERGHAKSQSLSTRLDTHTDQIQSHLTLSGFPPPPTLIAADHRTGAGRGSLVWCLITSLGGVPKGSFRTKQP